MPSLSLNQRALLLSVVMLVVGLLVWEAAIPAQKAVGELTEYEYLERMNALRDEFNGAPPPPPVGVQQDRRERVASLLGVEHPCVGTSKWPRKPTLSRAIACNLAPWSYCFELNRRLKPAILAPQP